MDIRQFGKPELQVSSIGLGYVTFGRESMLLMPIHP